MKKRILSSVAICGIALLVGGVTASAEEVGSTTTDGFIEFSADESGGGGVTEPGDPGAGEEGSETEVDPGDPGEDGGGSTEGSLRLVYVPNLDFGSHEISYSSEGNYYYAEYQTVTETTSETSYTRPSFFVVRDLRGGAQGWTVTVSSDQKLTNQNDETDVLDAQISVQNMFITNTEGMDTTSISLANTGTDSYTTLTDSATVLADAPAESGAGTYNVLFGTQANANEDGTNPSVQLYIPSGQVISSGEYQTTLTWAINDTY